MRTVSINCASGNRNKNFCVVSCEPSLRTVSMEPRLKRCARASRNAAGRLFMASNDRTRLR